MDELVAGMSGELAGNLAQLVTNLKKLLFGACRYAN